MNGHLTAFLRWLFFGLVPPESPSELRNHDYMRKYQDKVALWRKTVALSLWVCLISALALFATVFNLAPDSWNRVAWSSDLYAMDIRRDAKLLAVTTEITNMKATLDQIVRAQRVDRASSLVGQIFDAKRDQCEALAQNRNARVLTERLRSLQYEYSDLLGRTFDTPDCNEV